MIALGEGADVRQTARLRDWVRVYDDAIPEVLMAQARSLVDSAGKRSEINYRACSEIALYPGTVPDLYEGVCAAVKGAFARYKTEVAHNGNLDFCTHMEPPAIVRYEGADHFALHADNWNPESALRQVSAILYLNDVVEGGATEFPTLEIKVPPRKGRIVMFPSFYLFPHGSMPAVSEPKYAIVVWICFPPCPGYHYTVIAQ